MTKLASTGLSVRVRGVFPKKPDLKCVFFLTVPGYRISTTAASGCMEAEGFSLLLGFCHDDIMILFFMM